MCQNSFRVGGEHSAATALHPNPLQLPALLQGMGPSQVRWQATYGPVARGKLIKRLVTETIPHTANTATTISEISKDNLFVWTHQLDGKLGLGLMSHQEIEFELMGHLIVEDQYALLFSGLTPQFQHVSFLVLCRKQQPTNK